VEVRYVEMCFVLVLQLRVHRLTRVSHVGLHAATLPLLNRCVGVDINYGNNRDVGENLSSELSLSLVHFGEIYIPSSARTNVLPIYSVIL
jgi:hypothetical protein